MKILFTFLLSLFYIAPAMASQNSLVGQLAFDRGGIVIGADFERRTKKSHALGGFLLLRMENEDAGQRQEMLIGGGFKVFVGPKRWHVYIGPGAGIAMIDTFSNGAVETITTLGPTLKIGSMYRYSKKMSIGLEQTQFYNWFSDEGPGAIGFTTAAVRYAF